MFQPIRISDKRISFIERLFPELENYLFIHKNLPNDEYFDREKSREIKTDFDLTGSPLEYSFQDQQFEDTLCLIIRNWTTEETQHLTFDRSDACNILNDYLDTTVNETPIFVSCDGQDLEKTLLLGSIVDKKWFTTIKVQRDGTKTVTQAQSNCSQLMQKHIKNSNIQTSTFLVYNLYGNVTQLIDYKGAMKDNYESSINVHVETPGLTFNPTLRTSSSKMVIQVTGGTEPLNDLWNQLITLEKYLNTWEIYEKSSNLPSNFTSLFSKDQKIITENLNLLLNGDISYKNPDQSKMKEIYLAGQNDTENYFQLEKYLEYLDVRHNLSFTDLLWELLISVDNYTTIKDTMELVLSTVSKNRTNESQFYQIHVHNNTKFSTILNELERNNEEHLKSSDLMPLELLIDIGFEKLNRDYMYLLINSRFVSSIDIQDSLKKGTTDKFNIQDYRNNLLKLARVHICLEFISLVQTHCNYPSSSNNNLQLLFDSAYKKLTSVESPLESTSMLLEKHVYNLITPCPASIFDKINDKDPSVWRSTVSSMNNKFSKLKTITYYNEMPIFPTNIYPIEDTESIEKIYHSTTVVCSSNRIKR